MAHVIIFQIICKRKNKSAGDGRGRTRLNLHFRDLEIDFKVVSKKDFSEMFDCYRNEQKLNT